MGGADLDAPALVEHKVLRLEVAVEHGRLEGVEVVHAARDVAADARRRLAPAQGEGEGEGDLLTCLLTD